MKVWLDDERPMPDRYDVHVKTAQEAIALLEQGVVTEISLDHDLGLVEAGTGYMVAFHIEYMAYKGFAPPVWRLHTANPVGRENMKNALMSAMDIYYNVMKYPNTKPTKEADGKPLTAELIEGVVAEEIKR